MENMPGSAFVYQQVTGEFNGLVTFCTPSALFRVGSASRALRNALDSPCGKAYCQSMCILQPGDWVYVDDLANLTYNGKFAQVIGARESSDVRVRRYGVAVQGIPGETVVTNYGKATFFVSPQRERFQTFQKAALPMRSLYQLCPSMIGIRLYANGEAPHLPKNAVGFKRNIAAHAEDYVSEVRLPMALSTLYESKNECPIMRHAGLPLVLLEVEPACPLASRGTPSHASTRQCYMATQLRSPGFGEDGASWESPSFNWVDDAGPHLVFRADRQDFRLEDFEMVWKFIMDNDEDVQDVKPCHFDVFTAAYQRRNAAKAATAASQNAMSPSTDQAVIQDVLHDEPPIQIDSDIAAEQAEVLWAEQIEEQIKADLASEIYAEDKSVVADNLHIETYAKEDFSYEVINLLRIGSPPSAGNGLEEFRQILLHGPHLKPCRDALEKHDLNFALVQGAFMIVTPDQYKTAQYALNGIELHPFHLVVAEQFDYLVEEIMYSFTFKRRPRVKAGSSGRRQLCVCSPATQRKLEDESNGSNEEEKNDGMTKERTLKFSTSAEKQLTISGSAATVAQLAVEQRKFLEQNLFVEARSFLCEAKSLNNFASVAQSTTEVRVEGGQSHYGRSRGFNPRRID